MLCSTADYCPKSDARVGSGDSSGPHGRPRATINHSDCTSERLPARCHRHPLRVCGAALPKVLPALRRHTGVVHSQAGPSPHDVCCDCDHDIMTEAIFVSFVPWQMARGAEHANEACDQVPETVPHHPGVESSRQARRRERADGSRSHGARLPDRSAQTERGQAGDEDEKRPHDVDLPVKTSVALAYVDVVGKRARHGGSSPEQHEGRVKQ